MYIKLQKQKATIVVLFLENEQVFTGKEKFELLLHVISGSKRSIIYIFAHIPSYLCTDRAYVLVYYIKSYK
jgi:hypothetical protein